MKCSKFLNASLRFVADMLHARNGLCRGEYRLAFVSCEYFVILRCARVLLKPVQVTERTIYSADGSPACSPPSGPVTR